jgi:mxaJ protein
MSSRFPTDARLSRRAVCGAALAGLPALAAIRSAVHAADSAAPSTGSATTRVLRVAADPNNLPFTNERLEGFENRIAAVVARELGAEIQYFWRAQRRGFFRETLKEGRADIVMGVPKGFDLALTTDPYYRSTYVFVSRSDRKLDLQSLDSPVLKDLKIGVQLVGDDGVNPPAAHALARRGMIDNVVGFTVYGNYAEENPPARIVDAVARGDVDAAIVWGPLAGYFAKRSSVPLTVTPVSPEEDPPALRFAFNISFGVSRGSSEFCSELNAVLVRSQAEITRVLDEYGVPLQPIQPRGEKKHVEPAR